MYHRIAELDTDPWQLAVSPANFEQHLEILGQTNHVISVKSMVSKLSTGSIQPNAICLTFDDGYRDNFFAAKPLLEKYDCPASFFIATHYVDMERQFWWDELEEIILNSKKLPETLSMDIDGFSLKHNLHNEGVLTPDEKRMHKSWVWPNNPPTSRCALYLAIWEKLKPLPYDQLIKYLDEIRQWAGYSQIADENTLPMKGIHIESMARNPLFEIGIHTNTHPALASHPKKIQHHEIADCKQFLESRLNRAVTTMAYPYGNYNEHTLSIARELPLAASFTTEEKYITKNTSPYQMGRFQVKNWNGKEFKRQLHRWTAKF